MAKSTKKPNKIYLDCASATPIDPSVLLSMAKSFRIDFANSSAIHDEGLKVKKILEESRAKVAKVLGAHSNEIIFTSGATEANNLAIKGVLHFQIFSHCALPRVRGGTLADKKFKNTKPHIVTTNIEHASVLEVCKHLEKTKQASVTYVQVEPNGVVDPKKIKRALKPNTVLVSVMYANNEIGTIEPIREIAKEIRHYNKIHSSKIIFHSDATQAVNYLPINIQKLGVDMLTFNSAKIYGPKSIGVLFKKRNVSLGPIMRGGDQEFGFRPGTENMPLVLGLSEALQITEKIKVKESARLSKLRDYFFMKLSRMPLDIKLIINGDLKNRLPNNVNITIPKIPSDLLVIELSARGIMASAKSACKAGDGKASHVIGAIRGIKGIEEVDGSLRFSLGRSTTKSDIDYTVKSLVDILKKLGKWYN